MSCVVEQSCGREWGLDAGVPGKQTAGPNKRGLLCCGVLASVVWRVSRLLSVLTSIHVFYIPFWDVWLPGHQCY